MTKNKSAVDKNLQNVVKDLEQEPVNAHNANQLQQHSQDRRHQDNLNHENETDLGHQLS
ncbi:hypothetical protein [Paenibacillus herberti]|uniref:hypothetical protein n=1 Tax=Paenibacillus herberti TaxID=1619309 RepID=UPI00087B11EF|nr:hypothetical protein [Paenibacillus herberti]SDS76510.1 hypothetical protein SAMN05444162_2223 [Paenibacillaceae bacterium GAS479]